MAPGHLGRWSDGIIGLSYLWEGQVLLAERILRPALLQADADLGRRNPFPCMLAALLAAALWERDQPRDAELALVNRLDVLERSGLPEAVLLAFRTLARIAAGENEARALDLLDGLDAVGAQRALPRLRLASLAEQVMLHSRRYRAESCRGLMARIEALLAAEGPSRGQALARDRRDVSGPGRGLRGDRGPGLAGGAGTIRAGQCRGAGRQTQSALYRDAGFPRADPPPLRRGCCEPCTGSGGACEGLRPDAGIR